MKTKKSKIIAAVSAAIIVALAVAVFINGLYQSHVISVSSVLTAIALTADGIAIWYAVHNVLHELFHMLFAAFFGAKILEFGAIGLLIYTEGTKKKVKFNLKTAYAGTVGFVVKRPEKAGETLVYSLLGGLVGTVFTFAVIVIIFSLFSNFYTYFLVLMGAFVVLYMFVINYACDFPSTDGSMLFMTENGSGYLYKNIKNLTVESHMYLGKRLTDIPEWFTGGEAVSYYDVLYFMETGDTRAAVLAANRVVEDDKSSDNEVIAALFELFFIDCVLKNDKEVDYYRARFVDLCDDSVPALRAQAAYRLYTGEKDWAKLVAKSYLTALESLPVRGLELTERDIFARYIENGVR